MKMKKKQLSAAIASVLMITIIATVSANPFPPGTVLPPGVNPNLFPDDFTPYPSFIYVTAGPNPSKPGGTVVLTAFIVPPPPRYSGYGGAGSTIQPEPYTNVTLDLRNPAGTTTNLGNFTSGTSGATFTVITPDQLGTYSVVANWPGDALHQASTSKPTTFEVTEEGSSMFDFPGTALPTGYWESPVSAEYREWANLVGPWYRTSGYNSSGGCWNQYSTGPGSGHILWKYRGGEGGLIGGDFGVQAYDRTERHDTNMMKHTIMNGYIYYAVQGVRTDAVASRAQQLQRNNVLYCRDLRTGELVWKLDPFYGQETPFPIPAVPMEGPQEVGVNAVNFGSSLVTRQIDPGGVNRPFLLWYDATDGRLVRNVTMPSAYAGNPVIEIGAPYGDTYFYISGPDNVTKWNPYKMQALNEQSGVETFAEGIVWTVEGPTSGAGYDRLIGDRYVSAGGDIGFAMVGLNTKTGQLLYNVTYPYNIATSTTTGYGKVFGMCSDGYWRAWSTDTGLEVWKTTYPDAYPWGYFTIYNSAAAFGNFYGASYSGYYHCFDANTGAIKWAYFAGNTTETSMGHYAYWGGPVISGDGKMYVTEGAQHPITSPMERGGNMVCLNATTGEVIWKVAGRDGGQDPGSKALAEGRLVYTDHYTGYTMCFYAGKTATTISAPQTSVPMDKTVVIRGTVKDLSPAQPNTACVSEESMQGWMEYLNFYAAMPTNATGVEVTISVLDANNNYRDIGTTTTDPYHDGFFTFAWTPDIPGEFTVYANFEGTEGYWPSTAASSFVVDQAPAETPAGPIAAPDNTNLLYGILVAVIIAISIGLAAVFLSLRKK